MAETINIIVFGATGHTGPFILERGICEGINMTAFVRTPSKIPEKIRKDIRVIQGDVLNKGVVEDAITGHDVVLSALGTGLNFGPTTMMSEAIKNIVSGMKKHNVKKLAVVSGESILPGRWKPWLFKNLTDDHKRQLDVLIKEKESIDWIVVAVPFIKPASTISPSYMVEKNERTGRMFVTAGEIGDFMMKFAQDKSVNEDFKHSIVGLSNGAAFVSSSTIKLVTNLSIVFLTASAVYYFGFVRRK